MEPRIFIPLCAKFYHARFHVLLLFILLKSLLVPIHRDGISKLIIMPLGARSAWRFHVYLLLYFKARWNHAIIHSPP